jgi:cytochrome P450 family 6
MAAQAIAFFSAGNDTTSITLSLTLYELALNKNIQDRLRQEVTEVLHEDEEFSYESIQKMKYLDMVLNGRVPNNVLIYLCIIINTN